MCDTCTAVSMPTSSMSVNGPTGWPQDFMMRSTSSMACPSSRSHNASAMENISRRLTRKPAPSLTTTGVLPSRRQSRTTRAAVSSEVRVPEMTSTSGILCTGLKKCIPTTRSGFGVSAPIRSMESDEVLEASTASSGTCSASWAKTFCLTSSRSTTASMTKSTRSKPAYSRVGLSSAILRFASGFVSQRRLTCLWNNPEACSMPLASGSTAISLIRTGRSALPASSWAMPPPMTPAPSTAAERTGAASGPAPFCFEPSSRWKTCTRLLQAAEMASSAAARASASRPAWRPWSTPTLTTSIARSGAGYRPPVFFITCLRAWSKTTLRPTGFFSSSAPLRSPPRLFGVSPAITRWANSRTWWPKEASGRRASTRPILNAL